MPKGVYPRTQKHRKKSWFKEGELVGEKNPAYKNGYWCGWRILKKEKNPKALFLKRKLDLEYVFKKRFGGLREIIIQKDKEKCQICGISREEHKRKYNRDICVDHIDGNGRHNKFPNNKLENLRTLCLVCNLAETRPDRKEQLRI